MTEILCWKDECKYLKDGSACGCAQISIDEDGECENFEDYRDDAEWKKVFWKRMYDRKNKKECRVKCFGKELLINERAFYLESRSYYANLTDKETGLACGTLAHLNENVNVVGKIKERAKEYSSVLDLPIAIYDTKTKKFTYPEESEGTE